MAKLTALLLELTVLEENIKEANEEYEAFRSRLDLTEEMRVNNEVLSI